jgi:hypothetical protein
MMCGSAHRQGFIQQWFEQQVWQQIVYDAGLQRASAAPAKK